MPTRIKMAKQRLIMAKMTLRILGLGSEAHMKSNRFGTSAVDVLLLFAVEVGHIEGRPMTASKLSDYSGIPRSTVIRKLREMAEDGSVEIRSDGTAMCVAERMNRPEALAAFGRAMRLVHTAAYELSILDIKTVAKSRPPS
jgi:hypothetical protein